MIPQATENAMVGHMWPVGCKLPTTALLNKMGNLTVIVSTGSCEKKLPCITWMNVTMPM